MQDGSLSIWLRNAGLLTYSLLGLHPLVPPPSRINNNVVLAILACAACPWNPEPPSSSAEVIIGPGSSRTPLAGLPGEPCHSEMDEGTTLRPLRKHLLQPGIVMLRNILYQLDLH